MLMLFHGRPQAWTRGGIVLTALPKSLAGVKWTASQRRRKGRLKRAGRTGVEGREWKKAQRRSGEMERKRSTLCPSLQQFFSDAHVHFLCDYCVQDNLPTKHKLYFISVCCRCVYSVEVRLDGNNRSSKAGRLEVYHNGVWGTVCGRNFDDRDAQVACYMLGFGYRTFCLYSTQLIVFKNCHIIIQHCTTAVSCHLYDALVDGTKVLCTDNLFSRKSNRYNGLMSHYVDT